MNNELLNCPWSNFTKGSTSFCERPLCSVVESPGIAWAGLVYIAVGLYLLHITKKDSQPNWILKLFPFFAIMMGAGSTLYHSSHALIFQIWDVGAMFLLGTGLLMFNLIELSLIPASLQTQKMIYWTAIVVEISLFLYFKSISGPIILGLLILLFILTEIRSVFTMNTTRNKMFLWLSLFLFSIGGIALWIEHKSGLCNPDNHLFQWHAVWDSACAFTYLTLYRYLNSSKQRPVHKSS